MNISLYGIWFLYIILLYMPNAEATKMDLCGMILVKMIGFFLLTGTNMFSKVPSSLMNLTLVIGEKLLNVYAN